MKHIKFIFLGAAILVSACLPMSSTRSVYSDERLLQVVGDLPRLTRVTVGEIPIPLIISPLLCSAPPPDHAVLLPKQKQKQGFIHVYVTPEGAVGMKEISASFPLGTVILKQKFLSKTSHIPELYTGMVKRPPGYNPTCGDWEFFTVNGEGTTITSRGRIESCMDCHQRYVQSDFVTKKYGESGNMLTPLGAP